MTILLYLASAVAGGAVCLLGLCWLIGATSGRDLRW